MRSGVAGLVILTLVAAQPGRRDDPHPLRVSVIVISASTTDETIHPKLKAFAAVIQKMDETLVGFQIVEESKKVVKIGDTAAFALDAKNEFKVKADRTRNLMDGSVGLTVTTPGGEEISYSCTSGKFMPFVTDVTTKNGDKVLVAVMARPVPRKK